jgi:hypothetical protein
MLIHFFNEILDDYPLFVKTIFFYFLLFYILIILYKGVIVQNRYKYIYKVLFLLDIFSGRLVFDLFLNENITNSVC